MASSQGTDYFKNLPPLPESSVASRSTQMSVNARKRMLDIEARGKWRVYEREQSQKGRDLERQLAAAEASLDSATAAHNTLMEEVGGQAFNDLSRDQQDRYRDSNTALAHHGGELDRLRKELTVLNAETADEQKRMEEELLDQKDKLDILQELEQDQHLGSNDSPPISPTANNQIRTNVNKWLNRNSTVQVSFGNDPRRSPTRNLELGNIRRVFNTSDDGRSIGNDQRRSPTRNIQPEIPRRAFNTSNNDASDGNDHDDHRSEREGESKIGVSELVAALGTAFSGESSAEKKLPSFTGCPGEWLNFKSGYDRMNRSRKLEPSSMMRRLGDALKGDAKAAVQHLFANPANLSKVMEVLERRFGKAEFVLDYLVEKAKSSKSPDMKTPKSIVEFGTAVEALVENVKSYRKTDYLRDKSLQQQLVEKLPSQLRYKWHEHRLDKGNGDMDLQEFSHWLNKQVMIAEMQVKPTFSDLGLEEKRELRNRNRGAVHVAAGEDDPKNCLFCEKPKHGVGTCYSFKKQPLEDRQEFAKKKGLCFLCLEPSHMTRMCKLEKLCDVKGCGRRHHPLLHGRLKKAEEKPQRPNPEENDDTTPPAPPDENFIGAAASANNLAVIPIKVKGPAGTQKVYAMLDLGASFSMIEEGVARKLGLKGTKEKLNYSVFGDRRSEDSMKTTVDVSSIRKNSEFHGIRTIHTVKKIGLPPRTIDAEAFKQKYPYLRNMKASSMTNAKPQMVIGINAGGLFAAREILEVEPGKMPAGIRSLLGWYILNDEDSVSKQFQYLCQCRQKEEEMSQLMKEPFPTESFDVIAVNKEVLDSTPTKQNVVDDSTRANADVDLSSQSRWLSGPEFLKLQESEWPNEDKKNTKSEVFQEDLETKIVCAAVADTSRISTRNILYADGSKLKGFLNLKFPDKILNWFRLIRATAQSIRAFRRFLRIRHGGSKQLTSEDMNHAQDLCILRAQKEMFPEELMALMSGKDVGKGSKLYSLNPALNEKGIIVHQGRIEKANLGEAVKSPPILDSSHPYTKLMITSFHEAGGHWGQERIMNELRRYVWILDARNAVRRAWAKCLPCQGRRVAPRPPQMGQLPESRLEMGKSAFYHCGVDYFGPYEVKLQRSTVKRYGVLFTCLTTRAVHLELAQSLDKNDFLNTLAHFISIRGKPAHLWSDNGKIFVGAERELKECVQRLNQEGLQSLIMEKEMEFHFICPLSPHMGGSWERLIGSVKKILSTLVKEHHPKEDTLRTFLYEVMGIMNSRPVTYASVDPDDDLCLTPNDLMNIPCVVGPTIPFDGDGGDRMRKSWRQCQVLAQEFWNRFLPWLSRRQKWIAKVEPLKVGDIVLVLEDNVSRNSWKKGLIEDIIRDKTGQVRSAHVRVASVDPQESKKIKVKVIHRPAVKLCKLDLGLGDADAGRENVRVQA